MSAVIHDLQQGTDAWAQFRTVHFGASEAAACMGLSALMTRSELLRFKHTGIGKDHGDWVQEHVLDHGHRVEAAIRAHVEGLIGNDLYSVTCSLPGSRISASCDGLTLEGDTAWENKQWNAALAANVSAGTVPDTHMPQCQQVLMVTAAQRLIFTVTDGTPDKFVSVEVLPDQQWFDRIKRAWAQFETDLADYTPPDVVHVAVAAPVEHLPAVSVSLQGSLAVVSNLEPFGVALKAFVDRIPKKPSTDQEFADTEAACKRLKEAEDRLAQAEDSALASMSNVETMRRMVADFRDIARTARLASEKLVKQRKEQIREEEVQRGRSAAAQHTVELNNRIGYRYMPDVPHDVAGAIKGLKTLDSVRNAVDTEIARFKIAANEVADRIAVNMRALVAAGDAAAFPDAATLVLKAPEDLQAIIAQRAAEAQRKLDAARERIRAEETARAEREAAQKVERQAAMDAELQRQREVQAIHAPTPESKPEQAEPQLPNTDSAGRAYWVGKPGESLPHDRAVAEKLQAGCEAGTPDTRPPINLSEIGRRLGFSLTRAFIEQTLGITAGSTEKAAVLWPASAWPAICEALVAHITGKAA